MGGGTDLHRTVITGALRLICRALAAGSFVDWGLGLVEGEELSGTAAAAERGLSQGVPATMTGAAMLL